ncbi:MAG: hypothetical protein AAGU74_11240 [Bacillota bacterium]
MQHTFKRGLFDRYDGWRVRNVDPVFAVVPFILRTRIDSQNLFESNIPIEGIESFIRKHKQDMPDLTFMHVIMAAMVRLIAQRPYLNRFIVWNKIYARNHINISLIIKRSISEHGEETLIKPEFEPTDTLADVVERVKSELDKSIGAQNDSDKTSRVLQKLPTFLMRFVASALRAMDNVGKLPKFISSVSPWHCSMFLTNLGSLGIGPIYHHLYEFGTCSIFVAMGNKVRVHTVSETGSREITRTIGLKFVTDERICDGYYYASAMKLLRHILLAPECLLTPPEQVNVDDGVKRPRL